MVYEESSTFNPNKSESGVLIEEFSKIRSNKSNKSNKNCHQGHMINASEWLRNNESSSEMSFNETHSKGNSQGLSHCNSEGYGKPR